MQSLCQGKGQRSHKAKNRRKHFRGKIGQAISNLVAVLVSDLWAMAGENGTVFFNNWPPSWMCHSDRTGCWTWVSPHRKEAMSSILAQFYHMPGRYERVCVGWHWAKVKGHTELKIDKSRVKTFIYDFPKLHHSNPNSFGANVHLRQFCLNTVKVIERSRDVRPRSKVTKLKKRPRSPWAPNMVQFRPLFLELRHFEKNATHHFF